jgi:hypothetical protein
MPTRHRDPDATYRSKRGLPLIYCGQSSRTAPVLTVEAYIKWYDLYVISPDGTVRPLNDFARRAYEFDHDGEAVAWSDHIPTPSFCRWLAQGHPARFEFDPVALDVIAGRWLTENRPSPPGIWDWVREPLPRESAQKIRLDRSIPSTD